ncbi:flagellar motor protein MotB [Thermoanaerobacterium sp. RBIITD]|uniref:OmpA/MotB family protein n=1 Tax=Thermoanaerobacterium sp. RBIITD TaxID=1550240 RepID=UPI000BB810FF|nr:flagellar motor protein MotB [Thermoanaerobacterium sp. RBIITD]SNX55511.1 chemotaxis protein MotB [Thermoanaerobacterium sp. RBIITD]
MHRRKKFNESSEQGDEKEWMNTYADMMSLLLTFFVLMFSMATLDTNKFESIISSFQGYIGILDSGKTTNTELSQLVSQGSLNKNISNKKEDVELLKLYTEIKDYLKKNNMENNVNVELNERGLLIRFKDTVLFDTGSADIKPESLNTLTKFAQILKDAKRPIIVEGHTDNVPISNSTYKSNWELSTTRAVNVVKYFIDIQKMNPELLSAAGYGEYHPVAPNDSDANRSKNRRVDIVILKNTNDNS